MLDQARHLGPLSRSACAGSLLGLSKKATKKAVKSTEKKAKKPKKAKTTLESGFRHGNAAVLSPDMLANRNPVGSKGRVRLPGGGGGGRGAGRRGGGGRRRAAPSLATGTRGHGRARERRRGASGDGVVYGLYPY